MDVQNVILLTLIPLSLAIVCFLLIRTLQERKFQQEGVPSSKMAIRASSAEDPNYIYKNVELIHENIKVEIEEIRVQNNGVFIIVRKNRSGYIVGSENDEVWNQYKQTGDTVNPKTLRNPMAITRIHTFVLAKNLAEIGCRMWVQGIVVFTHPTVELDVRLKKNSNTAVLTADHLNEFVSNYEPRDIIDNQQITKIRDWLNGLNNK